VSDLARPIDEDDLSAFVDGQLVPERRAALQRYLDADPDAARRVAAYQIQRAELRAIFLASETGILPPRLTLATILQERRERHTARWRIAAAIASALGIGGTGGWFLHQPPVLDPTARAMRVLEQEAIASHLVYASDRRHPIEVGASDEGDLKQWLSNRLGRTVAPPDLSTLGYHLIGGRLLATERGAPAALFMYDDTAGQRVSLLLRPMAPDLKAPESDIGQVGISGCAWINKGMGYAVVAALPDSELNRVADQVRAQLDNG
jgi:anti-sigma factor RsiW